MSKKIFFLLFGDKKIVKKPMKKQKENPAGYAAEGKQGKGNIEEEDRTDDSAKFTFSNEITRRRCVGKGEVEGCRK